MAKNEQNELDHAHLQKPMEVGVGGVEQIVRCFSGGTDEIRQLLRYECDVLFECRICKSLFRAMPNLLIHKRNYCTQAVKDSNIITSKLSYANYDLGHVAEEEASSKQSETFNTENKSENGDVDSELEYEQQRAAKGAKIAPIVKKHEPFQKNTALIKLNRIDNLKEKGNPEPGKNMNTARKITKEIAKRKLDPEMLESPIKKLKRSDSLESSSQTTINMDLRKQPAKTLKGKELANNSESSSEDSSSSLWKKYLDMKQMKCMLCKICFSTHKSLRTHMKNFHSGKRTLFKCLYCNNEYTKPQSLKRHLIKGHKKTVKQVKRLGDMIQKNKFVKEMPNGVGAPVFSPTRTGYKKIDPPVPQFSSKFTKKFSTSKRTEDKGDKMKSNSMKIKKDIKSEDNEKIVRPTKKLASKLTLTKCMNCGKMFGNMESFEKHRPGCANKQSGNGNDSGAEPSNSNKKSGKSAGVSKKETKNTNRIESKKGKGKGAKDETENNDEHSDINGEENGEYSDKDSSWESIFIEESDDEDEDQKFDKIKKAGVRIDEENLTCLMCCMQYKSVSSLMRHCIRHLGWRRFKCKYCKFTAYHKSECKSHLNRVHKMIPKNAHELNKCIIEMNVDEEPKSHKLNMNISTNQPVRTVKAFTKQTRAAFYKNKKVLLRRKSASSESGEESSPVSSQGSGDSNGIRITRSGRVSQAPTKKYALETELGDFKTTRKQKMKSKQENKNGRVPPSTRSNTSSSKSAEGPSAKEILKKLPPNMKLSPEQNVQMQCVKIKSSDFEAHNSALKDLIQKQENLQVVNHQGKKFYVVVMPKGQALPNSVTPSKSDVAPEVINQALSLVKSPERRSDEGPGRSGGPKSVKNPSVKLEKMKYSKATTGEKEKEATNDETPILEPVLECEEIQTSQMKDSPPKLGAPYEVCETED